MDLFLNVSTEELKKICIEKLGVETVDVITHHHNVRPEAFLGKFF